MRIKCLTFSCFFSLFLFHLFYHPKCFFSLSLSFSIHFIFNKNSYAFFPSSVSFGLFVQYLCVRLLLVLLLLQQLLFHMYGTIWLWFVYSYYCHVFIHSFIRLFSIERWLLIHILILTRVWLCMLNIYLYMHFRCFYFEFPFLLLVSHEHTHNINSAFFLSSFFVFFCVLVFVLFFHAYSCISFYAV